MMAIAIIGIVLLALALAKHGKGGRGRNFRRYVSGSIDFDLGLTALAAKTLVGAVFSETVVDTTRVGSIKATYTLSDKTAGANIGPIICGVAHGDYTDAEVEEWIEQAGSWDIGNKQTAEVRGRLIRQIGVFDDVSGPTVSARLNDGKPLTTRLNWVLSEGDGLRFWAYNTGNAAIATTVPNLHVFGKANLWYQ